MNESNVIKGSEFNNVFNKFDKHRKRDASGTDQGVSFMYGIAELKVLISATNEKIKGGLSIMGLPLEKLEKFVCEMEDQSIELESVYAHVDQNYAVIAIAPDKDTVDLMIGIVGFKKDGTNESNFITKKLQRPCSSVAIDSRDYEFAKKYLVPASRLSGGYGPNAGFNLFIFLEKNLPEHPTKRYKRRSEICKVFARDDQLAKCIEDPDKTLFCGFYPNYSPNSVSPRNQRKTYMAFGEEGLQFSLRHNLSTCWTNNPVRAEKAEERYKGLLDSFKNKTTKRYVENKDPHFWEKTF